MKKLNITPKWSTVEAETEIVSVRFAPDGQTVGCSLSNGQILLKSLQTGRTSFAITHSPEKFSVSSIRFNPVLPKSFLSISSDGIIKEWNSKTPKNTWTHKEEGNDLYALDIHKAGAIFATAGTDKTVRIYDGKTKKLRTEYARAKYDMTSPSGHSDRIYCVHFTQNDANVLASGGWDNTIQLWDLRQPSAVMVLPGPHICGDAIDTCDNLLIAGSWRTHEQLQLFDLRTGKMLKSTRWAMMSDDRQTQVYTARFINSSSFIAGGSGTNQAKLFSVDSFSSVGSSILFTGGVYSCDVSKDGKKVCFGASNGAVQLHDIL